ncbi:tetrahydromethanopterin S-methyltransferase subunit G [Bradyrhizobium sp. USDA 4524]|uniref:hypothetical protein n=1 Tax=unclassified Bradyrhizobium TaxID=2631580 RepID=UPI00209D8242|nr:MULTISPECIES: hypothetical protein [unclassified Bradyrhizobium]MCP1839122.1 tetrahydromethanopterin S-methyltransferase subunit G [Bradyrhizobium sp. USDA 4538]MCP1899687.1 tetrahydromethanopterin S-methyltransferase subunit G [Bradyrhizobium sp. USDA 4537]MCP1986203.1 tetrahydromethanopterin S-methyltransferase subunit G [Bradyrhizobium sp. USDA 4539]
MSDRLSPSPDAKARYQALGEKELQAFFDEIPAHAMRSIAQYLPTVDGFRKTSLAGIAKQKTALARKLSKANASDRDFNGLYLIWRTWIDANIENPKTVHKLMDHLEEAAEKQANPEDRRRSIEEQVDGLLQKLKDESLQNHCSREQIERLFTFSPLPETPASRSIIATAKGATEVDRDATLSELPKRLQMDEDEIERIKSELKKQSERLDRINSSLEAVPASLDKVHAGIAQAQSSAQNAQDAVEALARISRAEDGPKVAAPDNPATDVRLEALAIAVESRRAEIRAIESKLNDIDTLLNAVAEVEGTQKIIQETVLVLDRRVAELGSALDQVKRDAADRAQDHAISDQLDAIDRRLAGLEQRPESSAPSPAPTYEAKDFIVPRHQEPKRASSGLRWDSLIASDRIEENALQSHADLSRAIAGTLLSLGLRKSAAQLFGEECAATVIAKQAIFLKGSFATQTARAIARVIGGAASVRIAMPIGLQDGEQLRATIEQAFETERLATPALVIEGVNRTALDITREVLVDCLDPGFDRAPARSAVIATISEGVASLPFELGYCEIGPVFDLNCLDWRAGQLSTGEETPSALSSKADKALFAQIGSTGIDTEEAIRLANAFVTRRDPSIERAFATAYRALHLVRTDVKTVTPLQSLFYGWLMPYWLTLGVTQDQIEIELDGGKVNGTSVDPRLSAMFKANVRGNAS